MPNPTAPASALTLTRPDDWHLHLRDGAGMARVVGATADVFGRAIIMPNLRPPVTTTAAAARVPRQDRRARCRAGSRFEPLMTLYLTDNTTRAEIAKAKASGFVHAVKYYPAGATTNSDSGVTRLERAYPALAAMEKHGLVLSVHGEVTDADVDMFDRERVFVERSLTAIVRDFPGLKIVARAHHDRRSGGLRRSRAAARRRDDHAAAPSLLAQRAVRRRNPAASTTACRSSSARRIGARSSRPRRRAARSSFSAPTPRRTRGTRRKPPAAARAATRRRSRCRSTPKRSRRPARSIGSRASRATSARTSTDCRATPTR